MPQHAKALPRERRGTHGRPLHGGRFESGKRYENVKIAFDVAYIAVSAAICLLFTGKLQGVREGSIVAALLVGNIIRVLNNQFERIFGKK